MATGEVEVVAKGLDIINRSAPMPIDFNQFISEEQRLKYRYLDLRRPEMSDRIKLRAKATSFVRRFLDENDFFRYRNPGTDQSYPRRCA